MHLKLPLTIIASLVERASASSIECVVKMIVDCFFSDAILDMTFHINLLAFGSMPVEGSSKNIILGFPIMAIATDSFRLFPPDRVPDNLSSYSSKFIYFIFCVITSSLYMGERDLRS